MVLISSPDLQSIEIIEVYVYYDRPLLFACRDRIGHTFLAVLTEEEEGFESWLYVELSEKRFEYIRTGRIDLHDAFSMPESGYAYLVRYKQSEELPTVEEIPNHGIHETWLPDKGEFINSLPKKIKENKEREARSSLREQVRLRLRFPNISQAVAPVATLGNILYTFASAVNEIGFSISKSTVPLLVTGFGEGSFVVHLESQEQVDLFFESKAAVAIGEFVSVIANYDNKELVTSFLKKHPPSTAEKLLKFLKSLSSEVDQVDLEWVSPKPGRRASFQLTPRNVQDLIVIIELEDISAIEIITFKGRLRGIYLDSKNFHLLSDVGEKISGKISAEALMTEAVQSAQINKEYLATIEQKTELKTSTGETTIIRSLMRLDPINQPDL